MAQLDADVVIVGAGPAGSAAAICCARAGLRTIIAEAMEFPRYAPGETLQPGVEPLLRQLGVLEQVESAGFLRHSGTWLRIGEQTTFQPYNPALRPHWLGFQAWRPKFDSILLHHARRSGTSVYQPCRALTPLVSGDRVEGVQTPNGPLSSRYVLDATGPNRWLSRRLKLTTRRLSERLVVRYGYVTGSCPQRDDAPLFQQTGSGWIWTARVRPDLYTWVCLEQYFPLELAGLPRWGPTRGADVTWSMVEPSAGPGYFLLGDAAATLDPTSSHGVLRALMTGMMAAHLITKGAQSGFPEALLIRHYGDWLNEWFERDRRKLEELKATTSSDSERA